MVKKIKIQTIEFKRYSQKLRKKYPGLKITISPYCFLFNQKITAQECFKLMELMS